MLVLGVLALIGIAAFVYAFTRPTNEVSFAEPTSFEECAAMYPVMESYPRRCNTPSGLSFTEEVETPAPTLNAEIADLIEVSSPTIGQQISSPVTISGQARGFWFFEATFPVEVRNAQGETIAEFYAEAQTEWMTEDFVPFSVELTFPDQPAGSEGTVVLRSPMLQGFLSATRSSSFQLPSSKKRVRVLCAFIGIHTKM